MPVLQAEPNVGVLQHFWFAGRAKNDSCRCKTCRFRDNLLPSLVVRPVKSAPCFTREFPKPQLPAAASPYAFFWEERLPAPHALVPRGQLLPFQVNSAPVEHAEQSERSPPAAPARAARSRFPSTSPSTSGAVRRREATSGVNGNSPVTWATPGSSRFTPVPANKSLTGEEYAKAQPRVSPLWPKGALVAIVWWPSFGGHRLVAITWRPSLGGHQRVALRTLLCGLMSEEPPKRQRLIEGPAGPLDTPASPRREASGHRYADVGLPGLTRTRRS